MPRNDKAYRAAKGFQVVCFSLYDDDIRELEAKVGELKRMGVTRANKSALIRFALQHVDLELAARALKQQQQIARGTASEAPASPTDHLFGGQPVLPEETA